MRRDAETTGRGESRRGGGLRVGAWGVAIAGAQLAAVLGLSALTAGGAPIPPPERRLSPAARIVAYVNGSPIMSDRLDLAVNALIPQESFHRNVSPEKVAELRQAALDTLVNEELQYQEAMRSGLAVPAAELDAGLRELAARYPSPEAFAAARSRAHLSEADVRREIRRSILIRKAREAAVASQCRVEAAEALRFFDANPDRFVLPEQLRIQAITIGVDPSGPPAAWTGARARAEQVRRELLAGAPFDVMARRYSTDPSRDKGGDMGFFHRGSLADEFEKATSQLRPGQISAVVQTIYGYHVVRVAEVRPSRRQTFDEVAAELEKDLTTRRCAEMNDAWLARLRSGAAIARVSAGTPAIASDSTGGGGSR